MRKEYAEFEDRVFDWFGAEDGLAASDRDALAGFVRRLAVMFEQRDIRVTPTLEIRALDVMTWWLMARRLQRELIGEPLVEKPEPAGTPAPEGAKRARKAPARKKAVAVPGKTAYPAIHAGLEGLGKVWDRLRKARADLEAIVGLKRPVFKGGLPDLMKPLMKQAEGIMEDAVAYEERRLRKAARKKKAG